MKTTAQGVGEREAVETRAQVAKVSEVGTRAGAVKETKATKLTEAAEVGTRAGAVTEKKATKLMEVAEVGTRAGAVMETKAMQLTEAGARPQEVAEAVAAMVMEMWQGAQDVKSTAA